MLLQKSTSNSLDFLTLIWWWCQVLWIFFGSYSRIQDCTVNHLGANTLLQQWPSNYGTTSLPKWLPQCKLVSNIVFTLLTQGVIFYTIVCVIGSVLGAFLYFSKYKMYFL